MTEYVADTHALFWYLTAMPQLGAGALAAFKEAEGGGARVLVPSIVLAELYYLNEKRGRPLDFAQEFSRLSDSGQFTFVGFEATDVLEFDAAVAVPEMHDRIIVGVALSRGCPCLTRDGAIAHSGLVRVVW